MKWSGLKGRSFIKLSFLLLLYFIVIILFLFERSQNKERESLLGKFRELNQSAEEYRILMASGTNIKDIKDKASEGLLQVVNGVVDSLGLRDKVKSMKMTGNRELKEILEETGSIEFNKLNMNEFVNLLYGLENHPAGISIKGIKIKKDFENPQRLNIDISIAIYRKGGN